MYNFLLEYNFALDTFDVYKNLLEIEPVVFNSFDHDNYKKDQFKKNDKGKHYYGKKRRYYSDYC